jgi:hypothetical protein
MDYLKFNIPLLYGIVWPLQRHKKSSNPISTCGEEASRSPPHLLHWMFNMKPIIMGREIP